MKLIIIESPHKAPTYKKVLGSGYEIFASRGHCVDLPPKKLGVDVRKDFEPTFQVMDDSSQIINALVSKAKKATEVWLLTDEDREGEAIGWHLANQLKGKTKAVIKRATTNEITSKGITRAMQNPRDIDLRKIDAYLVRRIMDRLCGYKTSFLTQQATGGRSAGRVQSAILRLLVEREIEIIRFVPEEYWTITAHLLSSKQEAFYGVLSDKVKVASEAEARKIYAAVAAGKPKVASVESKEVTVRPLPPFTTLPLISAASSILGMGEATTMKLAQGLYEAGYITYHRSDSPFTSEEAIGLMREQIEVQFGPKYVPKQPNKYQAKGGAQEAHECIRPTNFLQGPGTIGGEASRLYDLIWRRAMSSQMAPGTDRRLKVVTDIAGYDFLSHGNVRVFDGFRKVWKYGRSEDVILPDLKKGEKCTFNPNTEVPKSDNIVIGDHPGLVAEQKFTQPPPRYTESTLPKLCEKLQIGRPATYKSIIGTLIDRKYITKEKKTFHPTDLGIDVTGFLVDADFCFADVKFTADMEQTLDKVAVGQTPRNSVLRDFWARLKGDIEKGKQVKDERQKTGWKCPKCGGAILKKHSQFGAFFVCENGGKSKKDGCPYKADVGDDGKPVEKTVAKKEYADFKCDKCGSKMVKRKSRYGEFYGCEGYPKCRSIADLNGVFKEPGTGKKKSYKKKYTKKKKTAKKNRK